VVIVPALWIDAGGQRIGYGAGFYDRTLPRFCPPGRSIGVAFDFQLAGDVPVTEGDVAVGLVVTDMRVLDPAAPDDVAPRSRRGVLLPPR
jgi:5-formyltetrahydrofolate cyclo-ligase